MPFSSFPELAESIDQVIQSEEAFTVSIPEKHRSDSRVIMNRNLALNSHPPKSANGYRDTRNMNVPESPTNMKQDDRYTNFSAKLPKEMTLGRKKSFTHDDEGRGNTQSEYTTTSSGGASDAGVATNNVTNFFSSEIFNLVLSNPTTAHRLLRFCQSRACGENIEFLQKVDRYNRLLDEMAQLLGSIHTTYISPNSPQQINISSSHTREVSSGIRHATQYIIPTLESLFDGPHQHVKKMIGNDIYPRFVKHQITASATMALTENRDRFQGLGDCFCLTSPKIADNPILYASDGFVSVTGYTRKDIIPRNCRFLQGDKTDFQATRRLKISIEDCEETVELLLNYRKNGDPFWNLLYIAPLFNERGEVTFFLGGQINCSTTIHSCTDVLRILSLNDDELDRIDQMPINRPESLRSRDGSRENLNFRTKSSFFKSWRKYSGASNSSATHVAARDEVGMEGELIDRLGKLSFKTQIEAFYTAYSKYLVMGYNPITHALPIGHYSTGIIDMLCLNLPNGGIIPIYKKDIFKILFEHSPSPSSSSAQKAFKNTVRNALKAGKAVSVETGLLTGFAEKKGGNGWFGGERRDGLVRIEEKYITHWTPLKDENDEVRQVVLTISPKD